MNDEDKTRQQLAEELSSLRKELIKFKINADERLRSVSLDAENAIKESENRYKSLIDSITDYVYTVWLRDGQPVKTTHGPGCEAVTGYLPSDYEKDQHLWYRMVYKDDQEKVFEHAAKVFSEKKFFQLEHRIVHKNGQIRWVRNTPVPRYDNNRQLVAYDGLVVDINEYKKAEAVLRESEERYRSLFVNMLNGFAYCRMILENNLPVDFIYLEVNKAFEKLTGLKNVVGKKVSDVIPGIRETDPGLFEIYGRVSTTGKPESFEMYLKALQMWFSITVYSPAKEHFVAVFDVITERKQAEESLMKAKKEWEATFDAISDPLFIHDRDMRLVRVNRAYLSASGEARFKDIIGRPYYKVFPKIKGPFAACLKALELKEVEAEEYSCPVTNRIFNIKFYPIKDANDNHLYSVHIMEDVTEKKMAEDALMGEMEINSHLLMIAEACADTRDIDRLMARVTHCGHEISGCDMWLSYVWDKDMRVFRPVSDIGLNRDILPVFMSTSLDLESDFVRKALDSKEPVVFNNVEWFPWLPEIRGFVAIPLVVRNEILGLLVSLFKRPVEMQERMKKIVSGVMHQVSLALEQARLYNESVDRGMELAHKMETIRVMNEIDRSILSTLEPHDILEIVTRMISRVIPCERSTVILVNEENTGFRWVSGFGFKFPELVPFEDTGATEVIKTGRPQYVANLSEAGKLLPLEDRLLKEGFLSHIRVPLMLKEEIVGVLSVGSKRASAFTIEDRKTLDNLAAQISVSLQNARQLLDLEELFFGTVKSLSSAIDAKSPWTAGHSERVTRYAVEIGKEMGLSEKELKGLELAGLLHDVGKIGTYEAILDKPGKLTEEELVIMKQHPGKGAEILEPIKQLKDVLPAIRYHHEFFDGTGYPDGLTGEGIPLSARILTVADTVDAMGADRPYRSGRPMDVIVAELKRCSGTQFDPKVVEAYLETLDKGRIL